MEGGELGYRELFGAGVGAEIEFSQGFAGSVGFGARAQVVYQRFALLRKTQFHKIEETRFSAEGELCAFAGEAHGDERGGDCRWRVKRVSRDFKDEFGARIELRENGEIAIGFCSRWRGETVGDFGLDDAVDFVDDVSKSVQMVKDR